MRLRPTLTAAALIALIGSIAACSSDEPQAVSFCDQATEVLATVDATGALGDDAAAFLESVHDIRLGFEQAEPVAEIADDWAALTQTFVDLDDALSEVDSSDDTAVTEVLAGFATGSKSVELSDASDRVSAYITQNCVL